MNMEDLDIETACNRDRHILCSERIMLGWADTQATSYSVLRTERGQHSAYEDLDLCLRASGT